MSLTLPLPVEHNFQFCSYNKNNKCLILSKNHTTETPELGSPQLAFHTLPNFVYN